MKQKEFSDWNSHLSDKYRLDKKDIEGNTFELTDTASMNFSWGESRHPSAVKIVMVPHLNKVWFWKTLDTSKPWHHVKISHSEVDSDHPPLIYDSPVPINPYIISNLNKMVKKYIPEPQRSFYKTLVPDEKNK